MVHEQVSSSGEFARYRKLLHLYYTTALCGSDYAYSIQLEAAAVAAAALRVGGLCCDHYNPRKHASHWHE
jgi:hypothetical protein